MSFRARVIAALNQSVAKGFDAAYDRRTDEDLGLHAAWWIDREFSNPNPSKDDLAIGGALLIREARRRGATGTPEDVLDSARARALEVADIGIAPADFDEAAYDLALPFIDDRKGTRWPKGATRPVLERAEECIESLAYLWLAVEEVI